MYGNILSDGAFFLPIQAFSGHKKAVFPGCLCYDIVWSADICV